MGTRSTVNKFSRAAKRLMHSAMPSPEDEDILATLKVEHEAVKELLTRLEAANGAAERRSLVKQIKAALVPHTKAEEKVVYAAIIKLRDKGAQQDGHEGFLEHACASRTLQKLEAIQNAASPQHKAAGKVLKELVEHHIREEEDDVWSDVMANFDSAHRVAMNRAFLAAKARFKPH